MFVFPSMIGQGLGRYYTVLHTSSQDIGGINPSFLYKSTISILSFILLRNLRQPQPLLCPSGFYHWREQVLQLFYEASICESNGVLWEGIDKVIYCGGFLITLGRQGGVSILLSMKEYSRSNSYTTRTCFSKHSFWSMFNLASKINIFPTTILSQSVIHSQQ